MHFVFLNEEGKKRDHPSRRPVFVVVFRSFASNFTLKDTSSKDIPPFPFIYSVWRIIGSSLHEEAVSINIRNLCRRKGNRRKGTCGCSFNYFYFGTDLNSIVIIASLLLWLHVGSWMRLAGQVLWLVETSKPVEHGETPMPRKSSTTLWFRVDRFERVAGGDKVRRRERMADRNDVERFALECTGDVGFYFAMHSFHSLTFSAYYSQYVWREWQ